MTKKLNTTNLMSEYKFIKDYAQWNEAEGRYETWEESVSRVMDMHRKKYEVFLNDELEDLISFSQEIYNQKRVLASQRSLQFGGEPLLKKNGRVFNCLTSYCDRPRFFQEALWWLLLGGGVGFSVQYHHIDKLPDIKERSNEAETFIVADCIEGWADAFGVLLSSYFAEEGEFKKYKGKKVFFDLSLIRPEGAFISGGFKAPGPEGLRAALQKAEEVIESRLKKGKTRLHPIDAYDIVMHMSDAVLSGGIRRSATICVFSPEDKEMVQAKTGDWFVTNPQRGRSNNSALLIRSETSKETYNEFFDSIEQYGEPGVIWSDSKEFLFNPLKLAA